MYSASSPNTGVSLWCTTNTHSLSSWLSQSIGRLLNQAHNGSPLKVKIYADTWDRYVPNNGIYGIYENNGIYGFTLICPKLGSLIYFDIKQHQTCR